MNNPMHMFEGFISKQCDTQARDHPGTDPDNHNRFVVCSVNWLINAPQFQKS